MKTYHEMTESVLQKAGAEILKKERRRRNLVCVTTSGLCLALLLTVLGMGMEQLPAVVPTIKQPALSVDATDATQPVETQAKLKITYLSNTEGQTTQETVSADVRIPLNAVIRARDIRNLSQSDVDKIMEEERIFGKEYMTGGGYTSLYQGTGAVLSIFSKGSITLDLSECDPVKNVEIKSSNKGIVYGASGQMRELPPEGTPIHSYWPYMLEAYIEWELPIEARNALNENPNLPLSFIEDTITVTIYYENGAIETLVFDITVNDEGQIFVTQRGIPTEAA